MMKHKERGAALIELALIIPLLLLMTIVTTEFGRAVYQYNIITKSMRDAVRYLSVHTPDTHKNEARNLVVYGKPSGGGTPLAMDLDLSQVRDPTWQTVGTNPSINTVTITVSGYRFRPLFGSVFGVTFGDIIYGDISATMRAPS